MKNNKIASWQDYWHVFDELIALLESDNKAMILEELKDAQKYVNGLTDGWYEFKFAFEETMKSNKEHLSTEQKEIANFLLAALDKTLTSS